jgi:hypothetical protein
LQCHYFLRLNLGVVVIRRSLDAFVLCLPGYVLLEWVDVLGDRIDSRVDAPMILLPIWTLSPIIVVIGLLLFRWFTRYWIFHSFLRQDRDKYDAVWKQVCAASSIDQVQEESSSSLEPLCRVAIAAATLAPHGPVPELLQRHSSCGFCPWANLNRPAVESVELIFGQAAVAAAYLRQRVQVLDFVLQLNTCTLPVKEKLCDMQKSLPIK